MSDSINWSIWLPVIASVSSVTAVCSVGIVVYCYCRIRDDLTPVRYTGGEDYMREPELAYPNTNAGMLSGAFSDAQSSGGNRSGGISRSSTNRVKFQDDDEDDDRFDAGVMIRSANSSRFSRGGNVSRTMERDGPGRIFDSAGGLNSRAISEESEPGAFHRGNHIVEQDDGSQDVFV